MSQCLSVCDCICEWQGLGPGNEKVCHCFWRGYLNVLTEWLQNGECLLLWCPVCFPHSAKKCQVALSMMGFLFCELHQKKRDLHHYIIKNNDELRLISTLFEILSWKYCWSHLWTAVTGDVSRFFHLFYWFFPGKHWIQLCRNVAVTLSH